MKTPHIIGIAIGVGVVALCWNKGQGQNFRGLDAVRAGASSYVDAFANLLSPTCCTGCQNAATAPGIPQTSGALSAGGAQGANGTANTQPIGYTSIIDTGLAQGATGTTASSNTSSSQGITIMN